MFIASTPCSAPPRALVVPTARCSADMAIELVIEALQGLAAGEALAGALIAAGVLADHPDGQISGLRSRRLGTPPGLFGRPSRLEARTGAASKLFPALRRSGCCRWSCRPGWARSSASAIALLGFNLLFGYTGLLVRPRHARSRETWRGRTRAGRYS